MTTDPTAYAYAQRAIRELGQEAHDTEKAIMWCYDHPPHKPLPEIKGERNRHIYIPAMLADSLDMAAEIISNGHRTIGTRDALATAALTQFLKDNFPEAYGFFERYASERADIQARWKELRHNEPELQPQEEAS
jgi:hypothetical protein